jgi:hypothetical protein
VRLALALICLCACVFLLQELQIPLAVETMAGISIENPLGKASQGGMLSMFRGRQPERIAEDVIDPAAYAHTGSSRAQLDESTFSLTGFKASGSAQFSLSLQQPAAVARNARRATIASPASSTASDGAAAQAAHTDVSRASARQSVGVIPSRRFTTFEGREQLSKNPGLPA